MSFLDLGFLLPITITVVSAIVLFVIKEILDFIKIRRSDGRKRVAIRTLITKECEVNYDITRAIEDILRALLTDSPPVLLKRMGGYFDVDTGSSGKVQI